MRSTRSRVYPAASPAWLACAASFVAAATDGCNSASVDRTPDASPSDGGGVDTAIVSDAGDGPRADSAPENPNPTHLSEIGLYDDLGAKHVADGVAAFAPAHPLWSDGAKKLRWIRLPPSSRIDTSDMDHWQFPVGTKLFKEFSLDGKRLETRMIWHRAETGRLEDDYWAGAFVWRDDETEADLTVDVANDLRGTDHDAPAQKQCWACHIGDTGHVLGFSAIQLSYGVGSSVSVTLERIAANGWLTNPPASGADFAPPGDATTSAALGYLHANCGHCHSDKGIAWPDTQMVLRLGVAERDARTTQIHTTTVGAALQRWQHPGFQVRVVAGDAAASALLFRDATRDPPDAGTRDQMPPLATEHVDPTGLSLVTQWINGL